MQWLVRAAKCAPKRILKVWGNRVNLRRESCASGVRSGFESKDGEGANSFGWKILGVSRVVSYSWRIRWSLNSRNHMTSLQDPRWGVGPGDGASQRLNLRALLWACPAHGYIEPNRLRIEVRI